MRSLLLIMIPPAACLLHAATDEQAITQAVEVFRNGAETELRALVADSYVHVTPDGMISKSWHFAASDELRRPSVDRLEVKVWGDLGVASYVWRINDDQRTSVVMQAFQKQRDRWHLIATQVGGFNPVYVGPITATQITPPTNMPKVEQEIRQTWTRFQEANLRMPSGEAAEDMEKIRSIIAEDMLYIYPNGSVATREQRLALGHKGVKQLNSDQIKGAVIAAPKHLDEQVAVFDNIAVWTSRNPTPGFNGNQAFRVWVKRPAGWQIVADHQGMSYRRPL